MLRAHRLAIDAFVVVWVVAMLALGWLAMRAIDQVGNAASSLSDVAREESELAAALAPLESLPLAGPQVVSADRELRDAATRTDANAEVTGASIHELARIAFALVVMLALFPVVTFYLPLRAARSPLARELEHRRPEPT